MTIWDVLNVAGGYAGLAVLAVMALVPALVALPLPRRSATVERQVTIPAQRTVAPVLSMHSAA